MCLVFNKLWARAKREQSFESRKEGDDKTHVVFPYLHNIPKSPRANAGKAQH
jgi:hypothetical protein